MVLCTGNFFSANPQSIENWKQFLLSKSKGEEYHSNFSNFNIFAVLMKIIPILYVTVITIVILKQLFEFPFWALM